MSCEITFIRKCVYAKWLWFKIEKLGVGDYWQMWRSPAAVSIQSRQHSDSLLPAQFPPFGLWRKFFFFCEPGFYVYLYLTVLYIIFSENRLTEVPRAVVSSQVTVRAPHIFCLPSCAALHKQDQMNLEDFTWRCISLFKGAATFSWASDKPFERIGYCIFRLNVSSRKHLHLLCILFNVHMRTMTWKGCISGLKVC